MSEPKSLREGLAEFYASFKGIPGVENTGGFHCASPGGWPLHSNAAKVHPRQIAEAYAASVRRGVPTQFDEHGRPIFRSKTHRKDYLQKVRGLFDMDAGYSDPVPTVCQDNQDVKATGLEPEKKPKRAKKPAAFNGRRGFGAAAGQATATVEG